MIDKCNSQSTMGATVLRGASQGEETKVKGKYFVECFGADGKKKWEDTINNVVCTLGKNEM